MHARSRWRTRCRRRARFIRRTYAHLAYAVLGFLVLEYALLNLLGVEHMAALMTSQMDACFKTCARRQGIPSNACSKE
jgi:hypothetical protein